MTTRTKTVGWIGTGTMGVPMCGHVLDGGFELLVSTRTPARAQALLDRGAQWCESPADMAGRCDIVCTMLGHPQDVRDVILGPGGLVDGITEGTLLVDLTTSEPSLAIEIAAAAQAHGAHALDAPVSGGDVGAQRGTLVVMTGGSEAAHQESLELLGTFAQAIVHQGGPGSGQHTKMVNQIAIASGMVGLCEALIYAVRSGLDPERVLETISGGAAGSWSMSNYGPRMLKGDFEPGFRVEHFIKDLGIALSEARRLQLSLPGLALAQQLYVAASAQGLADRGTHSLAIALARLSDIDWPTA